MPHDGGARGGLQLRARRVLAEPPTTAIGTHIESAGWAPRLSQQEPILVCAMPPAALKKISLGMIAPAPATSSTSAERLRLRIKGKPGRCSAPQTWGLVSATSTDPWGDRKTISPVRTRGRSEAETH